MADLFAGSVGGPTQGSGSPPSAGPFPVEVWFDGDATTWGTVGGTQSTIWDVGAVVEIETITIGWAYGGMYPGVGASGPFALDIGPTITGPWTEVFAEAGDPAATAGQSYPGDFQLTYDIGSAEVSRYWRFRSTSGNNNDIFYISAFSPEADPETDETPYVPPPPARALIEIYVPDPGADRWGEALWGDGAWSAAGWVDVTYLCVSADISWGVTRPDAGILSDVEAGLWTVITYDPDRILDPANESSIYVPHITYGLPIRISHRGKVIRTGYCESIAFSHESDFGEIRATDNVAALAAVTVPSDVVLSDTLIGRARDVIAATGVPISVVGMAGDGPALSPWEPGDFTAWEIIRQSAREVHYLPFIQYDTRLVFRAWDAPIERGGVIGSPELVELVPFVSADSLYSVVRVNDATAMTDVERRITPLPRYGERVYTRTLGTINGGDWADRVLEDRAQSGLRWRPGEIFPLDADSVEYLSNVLMNEFLTIDYPEASPDVEVRVRVLGERIRVVDLGFQAGPDWRWWFTTTTSYLSPLVADDVTPPEALVDDETGEYLYPDGVVGLE